MCLSLIHISQEGGKRHGPQGGADMQAPHIGDGPARGFRRNGRQSRAAGPALALSLIHIYGPAGHVSFTPRPRSNGPSSTGYSRETENRSPAPRLVHAKGHGSFPIQICIRDRSRTMQRTFRGLILSAAAVCLVMPAIAAPGAQAAEKPQEWELVNPAGIIEKASVDPAKRIASLDGKTIALRWNSKHNGDVVLNRLAELLAKKYPSATIVKTYETDKSLNAISGTAAESERIAKAVASVKPDLVIASQCDLSLIHISMPAPTAGCNRGHSGCAFLFGMMAFSSLLLSHSRAGHDKRREKD